MSAALSKLRLRAPSLDRECRDPGSSRGPSDLQSDALPTELSRPVLPMSLLQSNIGKQDVQDFKRCRECTFILFPAPLNATTDNVMSSNFIRCGWHAETVRLTETTCLGSAVSVCLCVCVCVHQMLGCKAAELLSIWTLHDLKNRCANCRESAMLMLKLP